MILKIVYKFVPIIYPLIVLYWKVFRPKTQGTKVILRCDDEILLVKNTYGTRKWSLPGGGLIGDETATECARRETFEEVGVKVGRLTPHGSFYYNGMGKRDTIWVFSTTVPTKQFERQSEEISAAQWFPLTKLPENGSVVLRESLQLAKLSYMN